MGPTIACIYADVAMNSIDDMVNEKDWDSEHRPLLWARVKMTFMSLGLMVWSYWRCFING